MKKFTAIFTAILMMMSMVIASPRVFATDTDSYILEEDNGSYIIVEILNESDESIGTLYYTSTPSKDSINSTVCDLYGQENIKFCIKAKDGISVKIMQLADITGYVEYAKEFSKIDEMPLGMTGLYEIVENTEFCNQNKFCIEYSLDGEKYYSEISIRNLPKDGFIINNVNINYETEDGATVTVDWYKNYISFSLEPFMETFSLMVNGHSNNMGYETLSEGDNYFKLEYKDKKYNLIVKRPETIEWTNPFADVDITDACFNCVKYCNMNGLMFGTSDTTFTPDSATTRAMVVTSLYRIAGSPEVSGTNNFSDVEKGAWYYDAVTWASENGIVLGYENGNFGTNDNITREQFATIMYRYAKVLNSNISVNNYKYFYTDEDVSEYAREPMKFAITCGMIKTTNNKELEPKKEVSRADLAIGLAGFHNVAIPMMEANDGFIYN